MALEGKVIDKEANFLSNPCQNIRAAVNKKFTSFKVFKKINISNGIFKVLIGN